MSICEKCGEPNTCNECGGKGTIEQNIDPAFARTIEMPDRIHAVESDDPDSVTPLPVASNETDKCEQCDGTGLKCVKCQ